MSKREWDMCADTNSRLCVRMPQGPHDCFWNVHNTSDFQSSKQSLTLPDGDPHMESRLSLYQPVAGIFDHSSRCCPSTRCWPPSEKRYRTRSAMCSFSNSTMALVLCSIYFFSASGVQILTQVELCCNEIAVAWKGYDAQSFNAPARRDRRAQR